MKKIFLALALLLFASESWAPAIMTLTRQGILSDLSDIQKDIKNLKSSIDASMKGDETDIKILKQKLQNCENQLLK